MRFAHIYFSDIVSSVLEKLLLASYYRRDMPLGVNHNSLEDSLHIDLCGTCSFEISNISFALFNIAKLHK